MNTPSLNISIADYISQFQKAEKSFSPQQSELKKSAINSFEQLGFPSTKNEEWKYTNVAGMLKNVFTSSGSDLILTQNDIKQFLPVEDDIIILVFENGKFNSRLSKISNIPDGIIAGNINDYVDHPAVIKHLGKIALHKNECFVALNTALFNQGAFIFAEKNVLCKI